MHPAPQKNSIIKEGDQRGPCKAVKGMSLWGKIIQVFIYDLRLPSADNKRHGDQTLNKYCAAMGVIPNMQSASLMLK